jgi:hypothetical protein
VAAVAVFLKGSGASVSNSFNNFSRLFEFVIYDRVSHYLEFKLNLCQHGFIKSKFTIANLVTYLDSVVPLDCFQRQTGAIRFDLGSQFDSVPLYRSSP